MSDFVKLSEYKEVVKLNKLANKKIIILAKAIENVRSELTSQNPATEWCIDQLCIALHKIETKDSK